MGIRRRSAAGSLVAVLAALAALAGCSDDRERPSATLPPLSSSETTPAEPTDEPGAEGYPLPEEARQFTAAGALAFFDYVLAVTNDTLHTNDAEPLREISQPDCESCLERVQRREQAAADGVQIVGGDLVLQAAGEPTVGVPPSGPEGAGVNFRVTQTPMQVLGASGELLSSEPEYTLVGSIEMIWRPELRDWLVGLLELDVPQ